MRWPAVWEVVHRPQPPSARRRPSTGARTWSAGPLQRCHRHGMDLLRQIATDEVFSAAQAVSAGIGPQALARLVNARLCFPLTRGWYAVRPPSDEADRHRLAATALARKFAGRALISHHSALLRLGLPTFRANVATVHLTRLDDGPNRRSQDTQLHLRIPRMPKPAPSGVLRSTPAPVPAAYAAVQAGLLGEPRAALVAADAALHRGLVTPAELAAAVGALAGQRGIGPVRAVIEQADGRIESPGESLLGHEARAMGLGLVPQFTVVAEGQAYRADFGIVGTRVLLEFDGKVKYANREALYAEKRREDALRRAGWVVVRFTWDDLLRPERVRRRIEQALRTAAA